MLTNKELYRSFPEIKKLAVELNESGVPTSRISEALGVPTSFIYRWKKEAMIRKLLMQNSENLRARSDIMNKLHDLKVSQHEPENSHGSRDALLAAP